MTHKDSVANVYVATPSYGAVVTTDYALGLLDLYDEAAQQGFGLRVNFNSFDSLITRARNTMVAEFLADARFTHLMWIDGDIGFKGADVVRLLQADRPVVAGVYPLKNDGWPAAGLEQAVPAGSTKADFRARHAMYPAIVRGDVLEADADGFLDVLYAPTGFMLIKREVFLALMQRFPELHCRSRLAGRPELDTGEPATFLYAFFDTMIDPESRLYLSEDYAFCRPSQASVSRQRSMRGRICGTRALQCTKAISLAVWRYNVRWRVVVRPPTGDYRKRSERKAGVQYLRHSLCRRFKPR